MRTGVLVLAGTCPRIPVLVPCAPFHSGAPSGSAHAPPSVTPAAPAPIIAGKRTHDQTAAAAGRPEIKHMLCMHWHVGTEGGFMGAEYTPRTISIRPELIVF